MTKTKKPSEHPVPGAWSTPSSSRSRSACSAWPSGRTADQIREVFSKWPDLGLFAAAFGFYMAGISLSFARWYALVRVIDRRFTLGQAFLLGFIGNVFNLVIPGAVGGDFIKAAYLVRMEINRTQAVASMVIDRIVGLLGLFLLAGVAGAVAWPLAPETGAAS